ncbi:hypothetical protein Tco_1289570 [Tanacetum coccineum]
MLIDSIVNGPFQLKKEITIPGVNGAANEKGWIRFVTFAKQAKDLHSVNFDQLYAFLKHNEHDVKEVREMRQRYPYQLALLANQYNPPPSYSSSKSQYNPPADYHPHQPYQTVPSYQPITPSVQQLIIQSPPQLSYDPQVVQQLQPIQSTQLDSGLVVPSFLPTNDHISSLNKAMLFLSTAMNSKFPPTNNQLRTSSNPRTQATVQDGRVTVKNIQGCQSQGYGGNKKMLLAQAQEAGVILPEDQQEFLADRLEEMDDCDDLLVHTTTNFKSDHVDAYDSDCDDEATAYAIFMASHSPT